MAIVWNNGATKVAITSYSTASIVTVADDFTFVGTISALAPSTHVVQHEEELEQRRCSCRYRSSHHGTSMVTNPSHPVLRDNNKPMISNFFITLSPWENSRQPVDSIPIRTNSTTRQTMCKRNMLKKFTLENFDVELSMQALAVMTTVHMPCAYISVRCVQSTLQGSRSISRCQ